MEPLKPYLYPDSAKKSSEIIRRRRDVVVDRNDRANFGKKS
jgi:hypothetical protein